LPEKVRRCFVIGEEANFDAGEVSDQVKGNALQGASSQCLGRGGHHVKAWFKQWAMLIQSVETAE